MFIILPIEKIDRSATLKRKSFVMLRSARPVWCLS